MKGRSNPYFSAPLAKMCIVNNSVKAGKEIYVLYNPESYTQSRSVRYGSAQGLGQDGEAQQFLGGGAQKLTFELFFDTFSAGEEAGGTVADSNSLKKNALSVSPDKLDVRDYTKKIYNLMTINDNTHAPPILTVAWGSLSFTGVLTECSQRFTKFNEDGNPVRAILNVTFTEYIAPAKLAKANPRNSPDTSKVRTGKTGDALWSLSAEAYGDVSQWRSIANANALANPRLLKSGEMINIPAI
ncbi:MAG: LysM peptidoglycan-binding domain-containing protein [Oscillospiraceae bacterium]|jgi:hypothetical protein|nr:LysM peptidoglycan-binding domain-containing protein [Oscillospiraceae bacterium]